MEITVTKNMPRKILVLNTAKISSPFETFVANICVVMRTDATKISIISIVKYPMVYVIMKNQNVSPVVTVRDLNLGEDVSMLDRIDECY